MSSPLEEVVAIGLLPVPVSEDGPRDQETRKRYLARRKGDRYGSTFSKGGPGCYVAEVDYIYRFGDERFVGTNKKPFIFHVSGEIYIKDFVSGKEFAVRVKLGDPTISVVA